MRFSITRVFLLMVLAVCFSSCAWFGRGKARRAAEERARTAARPIAVGKVALVNAGECFALIEADLAQVPASGMKLRAYSGGAVSAELRTTGVRRRPFLVADRAISSFSPRRVTRRRRTQSRRMRLRRLVRRR